MIRREPEGAAKPEAPRFSRFVLLLVAVACVTVIAALVQRVLGPDDPLVWIPVSVCAGLAVGLLVKRLLPGR
jgi:hypothetical protein